VQVPLSQTQPGIETPVPWVKVWGGYFEDHVYFFFRWPDETKDEIHKPVIWNTETKKYQRGAQREDRLAIQFQISGNYSTDWTSGNEYTADMWHWKASRSNPLGLAHDKKTIISREKMLRSYKLPTHTGKSVYLSRPSDQGDKLYKSKRYSKKQQDLMLTYILTNNPTGSSTDVKAKGIWKDGYWNLELKRAVNTEHNDDVVFVSGQSISGGIAIFNHSENQEHTISKTLSFQFQ
jgi:hypothetical protein